MSELTLTKPDQRMTGTPLFDPSSAYGRLRAAFGPQEKLLGYLRWLDEHADAIGVSPSSGPSSSDSPSSQRLVGRIFVVDGHGRELASPAQITTVAGETLAEEFWIRVEGLPKGGPYECRAFFLDAIVLDQVRRLIPAWKHRDDEQLMRCLFVPQHLERQHEDRQRHLARILSALPDLDGEVNEAGRVTLKLTVPANSPNPLRCGPAAIVLNSPIEPPNSSREYPHNLLANFEFTPPRLEALGFAAENPALRCIDQLFGFLAFEAAAHARQQLTELLGGLAERYGATAAELFKLEHSGRLNAFILHNVRKSRLERNISDLPGIVPYVARERRGYCAPDVSRDALYREDVAETRSEIAVPVLDPTESDAHQPLLGVLNLECRDLNAFSPAQLDDLQAAVGAFVPHLRVLAALERQDEAWLAWHPEIHGWDLTRIFQKVCHALAASLGADTTKCSVWYVDRAKQEVFVYATNGYDIEYMRERVLTMDSCVGACADLPRGAVRSVDPLADFVRHEKAARMGLKAALLCPIYPPGDAEDRGGISVLSVYFTDASLVCPEVYTAIRRLSEVLGALTASFDVQRQRIAAVQLRHLLKEMPRSSESDFEVSRDFLKDVFTADGVTVFALDAARSNLQCVATTGLCLGSDRDVTIDPRRAFYRHDRRRQRRGFTSSLALHPNVALRMNNVLNRDEHGLPSFLPAGPRLKYVENFAPREDKNRRLLAYGVGGQPIEAVSNGNQAPCLGVIRILRRSGSKPFTKCDERLLACLAQVSSPAFHDWPGVSGPVHVPLTLGPTQRRLLDGMRARERELERDRAREAMRAFARTLRPIPTGRSTGTLNQELVRDMFTCYTAWDVQSCSLFVRHGLPPGDSYRLHAYYAEPDCTSPLPLLNHGMPPDDPYLLHQRALSRGDRTDIRATTFAMAFHTTIEQDGPVSGVRVPIRAWSRRHLIEAVVALDFKGICDWNELLLEPLLFGVTRVAAIWSGSHANADLRFRPPNQQDHRWTLREAADRLGRYLRQEFAIDTGILPAAQVSGEGWSEVAVERDREAALYGVRHNSRRGLYALPLHIGPIASAYVVVPGGEFPDTEHLRPLCDAVSGAWSQLILGRTDALGQCDLWSIRFNCELDSEQPVNVLNCQFQWTDSLNPV